MIKVTLISLGFTVLLALIDAIRIKIAWGKKENIDHGISTLLAFIFMAITLYIVLGLWPTEISTSDRLISHALFWSFSALTYTLVRLSVYNIFLNLYRILTDTNPTGRIDYVSVSTNSKIDTNKWWGRLTFWEQRGIAVFAWAIVVFAHYKLHQFHILGL